MNPNVITITFPAAVVEWADENGIDLESYVEAVIGQHIEAVVCAKPPESLLSALAALREAARPKVDREVSARRIQNERS